MSETAAQHKSKIGTILFAFLLSVICSLLITAAAVGLKDLQSANILLDKKINILKAAGLIGSKKPSKETINTFYNTYIKEIIVDEKGTIVQTPASGDMNLYLIQDKEVCKGYILPITTKGLWGKIQGYLAFEDDGQTVSGFSIFSHSETPGLGGEIESAWFTTNFKGKKILNKENKFVSVSIAKGKTENLPEDKQDHHVDGISGATLTGKYLSQGIRDTLIKYNPVSVQFRQKQFKNNIEPATGQKPDTPE